MLSGDMDAAEPLLQAVLRINPHVSAHNNLGFIYYSAGRFEDAAREFRTAVDLRPDALHWGNLGDAYRRLGRTQDAQESYSNALDLIEKDLSVNPNDSDSQIGYAMYLAGLGRCSEVSERVDLVLAVEPDRPDLHYYSALAFAVCQDRDNVLYHAEKAIRGGILADVKSNPDLQPYLDDPRLEQLVK